jgi:hypothetical protein
VDEEEAAVTFFIHQVKALAFYIHFTKSKSYLFLSQNIKKLSLKGWVRG